MAYNIGATVMLEERNDLSNLDKYENRLANYGALNLFKKQTADINGIITDHLKNNIYNTFNTPVKELVVDNAQGVVSLTSTYTCSPIPYGTATSSLVTVTPTIYSSGFAISLKDGENDAYAKNFKALLFEAERVILAQMEADAISALDAAKNQFWTNIAPSYYAEVADMLQVPNADWAQFYDNATSIYLEMFFNLFNQGTNIDVLMNPKHLSGVWNPYVNQGAGNATNTNYQFAGYQRFLTNSLPNGVGVDSTTYLVKEGSVGYVDRVHPNAKGAEMINEGFFWEMGVLPMTGIPVGVMYQRSCQDLSGANGTAKDTSSIVDSWTFSFERAFVTPYNSSLATRYNPIVGVEFLP